MKTQTLRLAFGEHATFRLFATRFPSGDALPLEGLEVHFAIRATPDAEDVLLEKTSLPGEGVELVDDVEGAADLTLLSADTEDWFEADDGVEVAELDGQKTKTYYWDLWTFDGDDEKQPLCRPSPVIFTKGVVL